MHFTSYISEAVLYSDFLTILAQKEEISDKKKIRGSDSAIFSIEIYYISRLAFTVQKFEKVLIV